MGKVDFKVSERKKKIGGQGGWDECPFRCPPNLRYSGLTFRRRTKSLYWHLRAAGRGRAWESCSPPICRHVVMPSWAVRRIVRLINRHRKTKRNKRKALWKECWHSVLTPCGGGPFGRRPHRIICLLQFCVAARQPQVIHRVARHALNSADWFARRFLCFSEYEECFAAALTHQPIPYRRFNHF